MIRLIVAYDRQRGIAKHGYQPWSIPDDEAYFAAKTKSAGAEILVGSVTYKTFDGPLKDRKNYVLTRDKTAIEGVELVHDLEKFLKPYQGTGKDIWVVGGANVYGQALDMGLADEIYATAIAADFGCQQFFPEPGPEFQLISESDLHEQNGFIYTYQLYAKAAK